MPAGRRFQRDTYNGKLVGVCAGFGDYFGIDPLWIRLALVLITFMVFPLVIPIYFLIAMITPKKPPHLYTENYERVFGDISEPKAATRKGDER
jgi:phage shock protein C